MLSRTRLAAAVDEVNTAVTRDIFLTVPYAAHLTGKDEALDVDYYLRHRVETIKRIRLTAKTDALALAQMIDLDYDAARLWSRYIAEELDHDRLYMADLRQHGYTVARVEAIEPFESTRRMLAYLHEQLCVVGPLAAVAYSLFVEWNSERGSPAVVAKAERQFSARHAKGARAHLGIDEQENHYEIMLDIAYRLVAKAGDEQVMVRLLRGIGAFFGAYFLELHRYAVAAREQSRPGARPGRTSQGAPKHNLSQRRERRAREESAL